MITLPPHADRQLIEAMSNDLFEILGPGLGGEFQYAAHCLAHYGESSVVINGVPVDYETLLSVGERFADSEAIRARAKAVRVNNRRYEFLYRR
jgi:hypothetical protein